MLRATISFYHLMLLQVFSRSYSHFAELALPVIVDTVSYFKNF